MKENLQNHHVAQFVPQKIIEFDYDIPVQSIWRAGGVCRLQLPFCKIRFMDLMPRYLDRNSEIMIPYFRNDPVSKAGSGSRLR
jgi:hypothetical protein